MKEKILLVGDTHGEIELINEAIIIGKEKNCKKILQLGDFGFFPNLYPNFINSLFSPIPFFFIDGNHDDHSVLPHNEKSPIPLYKLGYEVDNFFYIPRGYSEKWGESKILFIGGAKSIDKQYRTLGLDWWVNEEISYMDFNAASSYIEIDIIISHTCPINEEIYYIESDYSSRALMELINLYNPRYLIHGHHHTNYELLMGKTIIKGLGCKPRDMFQVLYV